MTGRAAGLLGVTLSIVMGCAPVREDRPPKIRYGEDACAACRMLLSDERLAAAVRTRSGEERLFDDIGCLLRNLRDEPAGDASVWAHDYETAQWINAARGIYVMSPEIATPMGYGLAAFADAGAAAACAQRVHGRVLRFDELTSVVHEPMAQMEGGR